MKASAIVCTVLAGSLGLTTFTVSAQQFGPGGRDNNRAERREQRMEQRQERREVRQDRRQERRQRQAIRQDRQENRAYRQGYVTGVRQAPRYYNTQPSYVYTQPRYYGYNYSTPRFYRGGYVPQQYLHSGYYLNNWNAYPGLYAPPSGYQWMQVGSDFLLVALATGLIANLLSN